MAEEAALIEDTTCRICLDSQGPMIVPCLCTGTAAFVHRGCLNTWRGIARNTASPQFTHCGVCQHPYTIREIPVPALVWVPAGVCRCLAASTLCTTLLLEGVMALFFFSIVYWSHTRVEEALHLAMWATLGCVAFCMLGHFGLLLKVYKVPAATYWRGVRPDYFILFCALDVYVSQYSTFFGIVLTAVLTHLVARHNVHVAYGLLMSRQHEVVDRRVGFTAA